jgi:hypothetical protein
VASRWLPFRRPLEVSARGKCPARPTQRPALRVCIREAHLQQVTGRLYRFSIQHYVEIWSLVWCVTGRRLHIDSCWMCAHSACTLMVDYKAGAASAFSLLGGYTLLLHCSTLFQIWLLLFSVRYWLWINQTDRIIVATSLLLVRHSKIYEIKSVDFNPMKTSRSVLQSPMCVRLEVSHSRPCLYV